MTNATIDKDSILSLIEDYNRQAEIERVDMLINNHINPTPVVDKVYQSFEESDINAICSYSFIDIDLTDLMTEEQVEEMDKIKMTGTIDDYSKEYDDKLNSLLGEDFIKEMTTYNVVNAFSDYLYLLGVDKDNFDIDDFEVVVLGGDNYGSYWMVKHNQPQPTKPSLFDI